MKGVGLYQACAAGFASNWGGDGAEGADGGRAGAVL